jgi:hypothetical protein
MPQPIFRQIFIAGLCLGCAAPAVHADTRPSLSFYGLPGGIDLPSAYSLGDGELALGTAYFGGTVRNTLSFQITDRLTGSFRYSYLEDFFGPGRSLYDRSFDLHYRLVNEGDVVPAVAVGLRDFGGTGVYGGEYLVATKRFGQSFRATGGIGWGRLGSYNSFDNPLGILDDRFDTRPTSGGVNATGQLSTGAWFRGPAALFGGIEWDLSDRLTFKAEYSSDAYVEEVANQGFDRRTPFNFGVDYAFDNGVSLGGYYLYGSEVGVVLSYVLDPREPAIPGGREIGPEPIQPRQSATALGWSENWVSDAGQVAGLRDRLAQRLDDAGLSVQAIDLGADRVTVHLTQGRYDIAPQALGRAGRVLANTLPASVETFVLVPSVAGVPLSRITLQRSDLEELEFELDGTWQSYVRAEIADAVDDAPDQAALLDTAFPKFSLGYGAYLSPSLFDPDNPVRADIGAQLDLSYVPRPGVILSGRFRQPIIGNLDESTRPSNSVLPHVRSDFNIYDRESDFEVTHLTGEYFFRPGENLYGRVSAGYLERMFGGVSGEVLWKPIDSPLALGVEVNYAKQRDFDVLFGFQDYDVLTGHASLYYDFGGGFLGRVDAGRYLAGDWGATFTLDREFANGLRVGAYFTLTDVSFEDFGEGSFDKGIRLSIPLSWLSGEPSQSGFGTSISPTTRDGGQRLAVRNRLYDVTRNVHDPLLAERWGKFWR